MKTKIEDLAELMKVSRSEVVEMLKTNDVLELDLNERSKKTNKGEGDLIEIFS